MALKLILDTDIGTDVDDAWALALCLASDEIDLLGVTLVHADLDIRAKIALKVLKLAGREDVPVYKGLSRPLTPGAGTYWAGHEGSGTDFSDIEGLAAREGGVEFILDTVARYPGEVAICSVGPLTNLGEAVRRSRDTMSKAKRLAVMGSTYAGDGEGAASREHNACVDPPATRYALESGAPATVVGLNVTMKVGVRRGDLPLLEVGPLGAYIAAMSAQYMGICGRDICYMHDPLAVAALIDGSLVSTRPMSPKVLDDGRVAWQPSEESPVHVCTDVDAPRFEDMLLSRVRRLAAARP